MPAKTERPEDRPCLDDEAALAFATGTMPPDRRKETELHLDRCPDCRRLLSLVANLLSAQPTPPACFVPAPPKPEERYVILSEIARGGQARILVAFDANLGRQVALKELLPCRRGSRDEAVARLLREAELTAGLARPGIVPVFEIGFRPDGTPFYAMQLVRGQTLGDALRERRHVSERLVLLGHFLNVCQVVAYAHSRGVVHRDIKPKNVMIGESGETVLLDWGLAKCRGEAENLPLAVPPDEGAPLPDSATPEGTVAGTPGYMSPEQARGSPAEVDERTDIFGLGAVLFEILAGAPPPRAAAAGSAPLDCDEAAARLRALGSEVPAELVAIAVKALAPAKQGRYPSAAALAQEVAAFLAGGRAGGCV